MKRTTNPLDPSPVEPQPMPWSAQAAILLATGLGFGRSPVAPGTVGALWGIPLTLLVAEFDTWGFRIAILLASLIVGVPLCGIAADRMQQKDPGSVVWDELATVPLVFIGFFDQLSDFPALLAVGFLWHRVFDISKMPPVNLAEKLPGGWGIMADDVVAAAYACAALHGSVWLFGLA